MSNMAGNNHNQRAKSVMLVTLEPISRAMAGPAIRCLEMGKQLASEFKVTLASPVRVDAQDLLAEPANVSIKTGMGKSAMVTEAMRNDILIIQSNVLRPFPRLAELGKYLVVDLYDPYLFSVLVQYKHEKVAVDASYRLMHQVLEKHMSSCDFSICASERQRDYWIGRFCALGKLTPEVYDIDSSLRKLIDVVPFGLPEEAPVRSGKGIRGVVEGIGDHDPLLVWGGGIWDWFDPLTVIKAVAEVRQQVPKIRLYFMGMKSPNPKVPLMKMAVDAQQLAQQLDLTGKNVFFGESWVSYEDRVNYLLDADIAVSAHFDLVETRFSFRTRILDYLWAGLPVLSTGGDQLTETIDAREAGFALPYNDTNAWREVILRLCLDPTERERCSKQAKALAKEYTWDKTCRALIDYCKSPHRLPEFTPITMPSLLERAKSVYARGGHELVLKRSKEILTDLFQ